MKSIKLSNKLESIGGNSFMHCSSLVEINILISVTQKDALAFSSFTSLKSVTSGNSLQRISSDAFAFCSNILSAYFLGDAPQINESIFRETLPSFNVYYLGGVEEFANSWYGYEAVIAKILFGNVNVTGTLKYSKQVTVDIAEITPANATVSYQWNRTGVVIIGSTNPTYTITQTHIGQNITVTVTGMGDYIGSIISNYVTSTKADGPIAPSVPTEYFETSISITLINQDEYKYRINDSEWQFSTEFTNLYPNTIYILYARVAETTTHEASLSSEGIEIRTDNYLLGDINNDG